MIFEQHILFAGNLLNGTAGSIREFNEQIRRRQIDDEGHVTVQAILVRAVP